MMRSPRPSSPRLVTSATRRRLDYRRSAAERRAGMAEGKATGASTKVEEVAANVEQAAAGRKRISGNKAEGVARRYFAAIDQRDLDGAVALWAPGGHDDVRGRIDAIAPEGVRGFLGELIDAVPDLKMEVVSTTSEGDRCGVHWRLPGPFAGPGGFAAAPPTAKGLAIEGCAPRPVPT